MKEKIKKILKKSKAIFKWIFKNIKLIGTVIGALFIMMSVKKIIASFGKVKHNQNWEPVPGDKTKVFVWDENNNKTVVKLPVNPETGKQVKSNEIKSVGLASRKEDYLNVEIKHIPTNRRSNST